MQNYIRELGSETEDVKYLFLYGCSCQLKLIKIFADFVIIS